MSNTPEVNYYYFGRALWTHHRGIVTAGVQDCTDDQQRPTRHIAFAFCAPGDNFRRHTGPVITHRVLKSPYQRAKERAALDNAYVQYMDSLHAVRTSTDATELEAHDDTMQALQEAVANSLDLYTMHVSEQNGCIDIVRARLGLDVNPRFSPQYYVMPADDKDIGPVDSILHVYNTVMESKDKPQLWRDRQLVIASRMILAAANAVSRMEIIDAACNIEYASRPQLGFIATDG